MKLPDPKRIRLEGELFQAEEALLAIDTRERHALPERYAEIIDELRAFHAKDPTKVPDVDECFSFDGDSFAKKLVDVCVSHNQDADALVERDREHFDRPRFPRDFPVGAATADLHLIAAALRLADILDFDRERTPATLFHYLVPSSLSHSVSISELEWNKHLSISSWEIEESAIVFRGRCKNHIVHHAVVQFCGAIEEEVASTRATFEVGGLHQWPFVLPEIVKAEIHEEGYHYLPYQFELDDTRVYELLMGRAIYHDPLVAIRELIQNAVDACSYRDALTRVAEPGSQPDTKNRITIRHEEPTTEQEHPILRVIDNGTGMDEWLIDRWFLKVGRSYYGSTEFARDRALMRKSGVDFAPVSEFGIGFLSCFLLADRVDVETAMWEPIRGDTRKRHLEIDGPTRLIRIRETKNDGLKRLRGTRVSLVLVRGADPRQDAAAPPSWKQIRTYIRDVCQDLPYRLTLEHVSAAGVATDHVDRRPMGVNFPVPFHDKAVHIPVADENVGLEGEIAIVPYPTVREVDRQKLKASAIEISERQRSGSGFYGTEMESVLLRGGFNVGRVPGLPDGYRNMIGARVRMSWRSAPNRTYPSTNLARTAVVDEEAVARKITEMWMRYLINERAHLPDGFMYGIGRANYGRFSLSLRQETWLEQYPALALYEFARNDWHYRLSRKDSDTLSEWESGKGPARLPGTDLSSELLDLILPRVAPDRSMDWEGNIYVMPPVPGWREALGMWHDFISEPIRWSRFVDYKAGYRRCCITPGLVPQDSSTRNTRAVCAD